MVTRAGANLGRKPGCGKGLGVLVELRKGHLVARPALGPDDLTRAQALRHQAFLAQRGLSAPGGRDEDGFDGRCQHVLVEEAASGALQCCFRLLHLSPAHLYESYSAQFYDLTPLQQYQQDTVELGRFCTAPNARDPDILRLAWAAITRFVDDRKIGLMFGCSSFDGADPLQHSAALAHLAAGHIGPTALRPLPKAAERVQLLPQPDSTPAGLPPLLRTYLGMGGWVSDHAVIDRALDTLHVFTGVEVANIPPARARALRALAG